MLYGNISFTARTDAHVPCTCRHTQAVTHTQKHTLAQSVYAYENESVPNILILHLRGPNEKA